MDARSIKVDPSECQGVLGKDVTARSRVTHDLTCVVEGQQGLRGVSHEEPMQPTPQVTLVEAEEGSEGHLAGRQADRWGRK